MCVEEGERAKFVFVDTYVGENAKRPAKILWVAFFASWCEPCKKELPKLNELYKAYKDQGLQVLAINIDKDPDEIAKAREIVKAIAPDFPVLSDKMQIVTRRYFDTEKSISLPANLVIDSNGAILSTLAGADQKQTDGDGIPRSRKDWGQADFRQRSGVFVHRYGRRFQSEIQDQKEQSGETKKKRLSGKPLEKVRNGSEKPRNDLT